jgi:hypothetical protein
MADNTADQIAMLCAITNCTPQQAAQLLANAGGDMNLAVNDFWEGGGGDSGDGAPPQQGGGGGGGGAAPGPAANDDESEDDEEDHGDDDDEDYDSDDEFAEGNVLLGYDGGNAASPLAPPPSKRAKVDMRSPPKLPAASEQVKGQLQVLFSLNAPPADCEAKLHRAVDDRKQSWAYGDERSLTCKPAAAAPSLDTVAAPSP